VNLPLPRATRDAFAYLHPIFSQRPFSKGGKSARNSPSNSPKLSSL
jgi:hypothetical protein